MVTEIGSGWWISPEGEVSQVGNFHEPSAFQKLFDLNRFNEHMRVLYKNILDSEMSMEEKEDVIRQFAKILVIDPTMGNAIFSMYLKGFMSWMSQNPALHDAIPQVDAALRDASASEEVVAAVLNGDLMQNVYMNAGAIRLRLGPDGTLFVEVQGLNDKKLDAVVDFMDSQNIRVRTVILEDKESGRKKELSVSSFLGANTPQKLWRAASSPRKLLVLARLFSKLSG
jgi:hypothetical protein